MRRVFDFLLKKTGESHPYTDKGYWGRFEGYVSIILNMVLFAVKLAIGIASGSVAVIADAVHTVSDVISSAGVVMGFRAAYMPPDCEHPFGHRRIEHITTLVISFLLILTGLEFVKRSFEALTQHKDVERSLIFAAVIAVTIIIKELMAHLSFYIGEKIGSRTLKADGWHHRTDAISSAVVVATFIIPGADGWKLPAPNTAMVPRASSVSKLIENPSA